jgi:hypothetical protein
MTDHSRRRPTPSLVISLIALFVALGGTAWGVAVNSVGSKTIRNNSIRSLDVRNNGLTGSDVRNGRLGGADVRNNSLRGADILESSLAAVPSATSATSAATAGDANTLDGLDSTAFTRSACTSQTGALKGFAQVNASAGFSATFTTTGVQGAYNCSGQTVEVRRIGAGTYEVRFNGVALGLALVSSLEIDSVPGIVTVNVSRMSATPPTFFRVHVTDGAGLDTDVPFMIAIV